VERRVVVSTVTAPSEAFRRVHPALSYRDRSAVRS
jgi:hypothetical protein